MPMKTILLTCFALFPLGTQIASHELVHALEDHLAAGALHVQNAHVAQHLGTITLTMAPRKSSSLAGVKRALSAVDKALHIIVIVVVMRVVAVLAMLMIAVVVSAMLIMHMFMLVLMGVIVMLALAMVVIAGAVVTVVMSMFMLVFPEEVGVDVQLGIQIEAAQVQTLSPRGTSPKCTARIGARGFMCFEAVGQRVGRASVTRSVLDMKHLVGKTHLTARFLARVQLLIGVLGIDQRDDGVDQIGLGNLIVHEERLSHGAGDQPDRWSQ